MPFSAIRSPRWLILGVAVLAALTALAQNHDPTAPPAIATENADGAPPAARALSPLMQDIRTVFEAEKTALASLKVRLQDADDEREILSLLHEIDQVKQETELQVLQIQSDSARREGRTEAAERIEATIAVLRAGPPRAAPRENTTADPSARK